MSLINLFDWQKPGHDAHVRILKQKNFTVEASSTGYGKTIVAIAVARTLGLRPCILCPKVVIPAWEEVCLDMGVTPCFVLNYEKLRTGNTTWGEWKIKNKQWLWNVPQEDTLFIFDEAHKCKTRTSKNAKMMVAAIRQGFKIMAVSATIAESPLDMFAIGFGLGFHDTQVGWLHFMSENKVKRGHFGYVYTGGLKGMEALHARIFPDNGHRVNTREIPGYPENFISTLAVDSADASTVQAHIDELMEKKKDDVALPIVDALRLRQEVELLKVEGLVEFASQSVDEGNNVVIFCNFHATMDALREKLSLSYNVGVLKGGDQTPEESQEAIDSFQSNISQILICQIKKGGVGISLHDVKGRPRVSYICPTDSAIDTVQAIGRIHRAKALSPAVQYLVFARKTIEEKVRARVQKKLRNIETLNDGDFHTF